jgi:hypothetical protein
MDRSAYVDKLGFDANVIHAELRDNVARLAYERSIKAGDRVVNSRPGFCNMETTGSALAQTSFQPISSLALGLSKKK